MKLIYIATLIIVVTSCTHKANTATDTTTLTTPLKIEYAVATNKADSIANAYLMLKDAFVSDSLPLVDAANTNLVITIGTTIVTQQVMLLQQAVQLAAATTLKDKRFVFKDMAKPLQQIISGTTTTKLYVQHCPMAYNNKGAYWVSNVAEIKNPYYPKQMLDCGEVTDSLAIAK